ncbi:pyridoxal phosphate-dependent transferase [Lipomyces kononenkoae]|uniref:Pyridoxal phosphate-dependent transferase n=1 Tax=Lipomyces kononenkoae TaxID=34357 RepID=A0ACC3SWP8_LIPKO
MASSLPTPFGHDLRNYFLFDSEYINLNHGSFGTYPVVVRDYLRKQQDEVEAQPDKYIRYTFSQLLDKSRAAVAEILSVPVNECVFIQNATSGVNTVLRNLVYAPTDVIIYFDTIYGACQKTIQSICETTPATCRKVEYQFMVDSHRDIVRKFKDLVSVIKKEGLVPKVAIFDTIVSLPGVRFPFEKLVKACKDERVLSLIDGAHGIGHIPLDLKQLDADFFTSNCHKWLFTPRGCAVLHVPVRNQALIRTTFPTSHGFNPIEELNAPNPHLTLSPGKSQFESLFEFVATMDSSPYTCVPTALAFRRDVCGGEDNIIEYMQYIVTQGTNAVASMLGTEVMATDASSPADELRNCALANVRLPLSVGTAADADVAAEDFGEICNWMQTTMVDKFHTFLPIFFYGGHLWARFSGQVYLETSDFKFAGNLLKGLCKAVQGDKVRSFKTFDIEELRQFVSKAGIN